VIDAGMNRVEKLQYENLRKCFQANLIKPILGENYYNMAMDVYTCDECTTLDLKQAFDCLKRHNKIYKFLLICSFFIIVGLIVVILMQ
jgi:hypothetical protein